MNNGKFTSPSPTETPTGKSEAGLWGLACFSALFTVFLICDGIISCQTRLPEFLFTLVPQWFVRRFFENLPRWLELSLVLSVPGVAMGSCFLTGLFAMWRFQSAEQASRRATHRRVAVAAACAIMVNLFCIFSLWRAYFAAF